MRFDDEIARAVELLGKLNRLKIPGSGRGAYHETILLLNRWATR